MLTLDNNTCMSNNKDHSYIYSLPEDEKLFLANEVGQLILESALLRLLTTMSSDDVKQLECYIDNEIQENDLLEYLELTYKDFSKFLEEEMRNFQNQTELIIDDLSNKV